MDNDSNVPCTREMMSDLHARGKAFLILLNVKASMQGGLDLFRSRLDALFAKEGEQSISGNIAAIRRDLANCIGIQSARAVPIITIHAKAGFKHREINEPVEAEQWRQLSRIDHFLEQLDDLITRQAPELRRQTLRKNPRLELESITSKLKELQRQLDLQAKVFGDTKASAEKQVWEIFAELHPVARERVDELFAPLELAAQRFSSQHFKKNAKQLECLWREEIERADLPAHVKDLVNWLKAELAERLQKLQEYIQERLKFQAQTLTLNIEIRLEFSFDIDFDEAIRRNVNLGFKILAGVLGFVGLFTGGTALLILPVVIAFLPDVFDWLIPGADKQKAQQALKQELLKTLNEPKAKLAEQLEQLLREQCDELASAITQGLGGSEAALLAFSSQIERCSRQIERQAQTLS